MPILKAISGHTGCGAVKRYLTKDNRPLAVDLINLLEEDWAGRDWAQQMDYTRAFAGNNESVNGRPTRTYNHYILSPDPLDNITLEQLREICVAWTEKYLPDFESAIVYHDDNESGIMHAHIVVNNTNLETLKRLAPFLTKAYVREMSDGLQEMAKERGLRNFIDKGASDIAVLEAVADGFHGLSLDEINKEAALEKTSKPLPTSDMVTNQRDYKSKAEREILKEHGWSWKEDIRARVKCARNLAVDEKDFISKCEDLDLKVKRARNGDYLFVHPEKETWQCKGGTLGAAYRRDTVIRELQADSQMGAPKPQERQYQAIKSNLDAMRAGKMRRIAYVDETSGITLKDIADALETNRQFSIYTERDYKEVAAANPTDRALHKQLNKAREISIEAHLLDYAVRSALKQKPMPAKNTNSHKSMHDSVSGKSIDTQQQARQLASEKSRANQREQNQKRRGK